MASAFGTFWTAEHGAVSVDWVVLSGIVIGLGFATLSVVSGGVRDIPADVSQILADYEPVHQGGTFGVFGTHEVTSGTDVTPTP